ncbi:MAG TPA: SH3 domain-containing protein [Gemmatimonadales bacterium]|nr:SH3 domain-containing protein [Gemmatimonadales bacterium]
MKDERICQSCGKTALPVATRCPRCGNAFELRYDRPPIEPSRRSRLFTALTALVVVALVAANALRNRGSSGGVLPPHEEAGMSAPAAPATIADRPAQPDSAADQTPAPVPAPAPAPPVAVQTPAPAPERSAARLVFPAGSTGRRYATTWINLRAARNNRARVVRILQPGEPVRVDSLDQGWYQVVTADQVQGYADRRLLSDATPTQAP